MFKRILSLMVFWWVHSLYAPCVYAQWQNPNTNAGPPQVAVMTGSDGVLVVPDNFFETNSTLMLNELLPSTDTRYLGLNGGGVVAGHVEATSFAGDGSLLTGLTNVSVNNFFTNDVPTGIQYTGTVRALSFLGDGSQLSGVTTSGNSFFTNNPSGGIIYTDKVTATSFAGDGSLLTGIQSGTASMPVKMSVWAGQSQMVGAVFDPTFYVGDWTNANPKIHWAARNTSSIVYTNVHGSGTWGPELSGGHALLAAANGDPVIVIKYAFGGTTMGDWLPGQIHYDRLTNVMIDAQAYYTNLLNRPVSFESFNWWQGESDTLDSSDANAWASRFTTMYNQLEIDVPNFFGTPAVIAVIDRPAEAFNDVVRAQQMQDSFWRYIDTRGYYKVDGIHVDRTALLEMGYKFVNESETTVNIPTSPMDEYSYGARRFLGENQEYTDIRDGKIFLSGGPNLALNEIQFQVSNNTDGVVFQIDRNGDFFTGNAIYKVGTPGGTGEFIWFQGSSILSLWAGGRSHIHLTDGGRTVFNVSQSSLLDYEFRTSGATNTLMVNSGLNRVGIGTDNPGALLHVAGDMIVTNITAEDVIAPNLTIGVNDLRVTPDSVLIGSAGSRIELFVEDRIRTGHLRVQGPATPAGLQWVPSQSVFTNAGGNFIVQNGIDTITAFNSSTGGTHGAAIMLGEVHDTNLVNHFSFARETVLGTGDGDFRFKYTTTTENPALAPAADTIFTAGTNRNVNFQYGITFGPETFTNLTSKASLASTDKFIILDTDVDTYKTYDGDGFLANPFATAVDGNLQALTNLQTISTLDFNISPNGSFNAPDTFSLAVSQMVVYAVSGAADQDLLLDTINSTNTVKLGLSPAAGDNDTSVASTAFVQDARSKSIIPADFGDTTSPHVLTQEEVTAKIISNYAVSGADRVYTMPAPFAAGNVIFVIGDQFQIDVEPDSGDLFYLNGIAMAVDEHIVNVADTLAQRMVGYCVNIDGTLRWMFYSADTDFAQATP